jgi:hypothetical protein
MLSWTQRTVRSASAFSVLVLGIPLASSADSDLRAVASHNRTSPAEPHLHERAFIPGSLGRESGRPPPAVGATGFHTRYLAELNETALGQWAHTNQLTGRMPNSHNLHRILPASLFASYPEFFPEVAGERWEPPGNLSRVNWNPDLGEPAVAEWVATQAARHFSGNPQTEVFSVATNDGLIFGDSAATRRWAYPPRWFRQRPDYSDLVFNFTNEVAGHLSADWPGKFVSQLAYYWTEHPPTFPLHPRVIPVLATDQSQLYHAAFRAGEIGLLEAWGASGAERLALWHYLFGSGFLIPRQHITLIAEHLRAAREAGFTDYFAETGFNWGLDGPQPWITALLLTDPFQALEPLLDEYYERFFRAAAEPMRAFFERCEEIWRNQPGPPYWLKHFINESQAELFPPSENRRLRRLLDEAAGLVAGDSVAAQRVALTSAAFSVTEAFAHFHEARQNLGDALLNRLDDEAPEHLQALLEVYEDARDGDSGFLGTLRRVEEAYPLAMHDVRPGVFLLNDPGPVARALLAASVGEFSPAHPLVPDLGFGGERTGRVELAGLKVRLDMPPGWGGRVEPWQGFRVDWLEQSEGTPVLRMENQKRLEIWNWQPVPSDVLGLAALEVRGRLSPGAFSLLRASWADESGNFLGEEAAIRLHEGHHPDWRSLRLLLRPPVGATRVRYRITTFHMMKGDFLEIREPSLTWYWHS